MTWGEVSKWAKEHGFKISRKDGTFVWSSLDDPAQGGSEADLENVAKAVFNEISGHKWVDHQREYGKKTAKK